MSLSCVLLVLLLPVAVHAVAFEPHWVTGLSVTSDPLPGETDINGMSFRMQRVTGRDVPLVVERIATDWREQAGGELPRLIQQRGWSMLSRIHDGRSEVVQWREWDTSAELLWSEGELQQQSSAARLPTYLPAKCKWMRPIVGRVASEWTLQITGHCPAGVPAMVASLETALYRQGWRTHSAAGLLIADRADGHVEAVFAPAESTAVQHVSTTVVLVETGTTRAQQP